MHIVFTDVYDCIDKRYHPAPATEYLPDWYKATPEYVDGEKRVKDGATPHTVKKCIPVFDALTAGYIIPSPTDVQVTIRDGRSWFEWPHLGGIDFHPVVQAPLHPFRNGNPYPKWSNPWVICTPPGYSCLFVEPLHNPNPIFSVLPGIVDTDTYKNPVNFPFVLRDIEWTGLIPAGTPIIQVIPFKRDEWKMNLGGDKERADRERTSTLLRSVWFNSYKRLFWSRKSYR